MSTLVVSIPHISLDDGTIANWRADYPHRRIVTPEDYTVSEGGLFDHDPGTEIVADTMLVGQVRDIIKNSTESSVLIRLSKPLKGKITGAKVINLTFPSARELPAFIAEHAGVSQRIATTCITQSSSPIGALVLARQASLLAPGDSMRGLIDISSQDTPPWGIIDAIFSGDAVSAARRVIDHINVTNDPVGLFFQVSGFIRKVMTAPIDGGSNYFMQRHRKIKDMSGLINDIAVFADPILSVAKRDGGRTVAAFAVSASTRCK